MLQSLFVYGTLRDPELQKHLFGKSLRATPAILYHWKLYECLRDGYLFIKPCRNQKVVGDIIELTCQQLSTADAWELVPYYQRERVRPTTHTNNVLRCWGYSRRNARGKSITTSKDYLEQQFQNWQKLPEMRQHRLAQRLLPAERQPAS